jgi:protein-S-isoprenylcysteine O-methyltransferase Ste14
MNKNVVRRIANVVVVFLLQGIILFIASGTLYWNWAWFFIFVQIAVLLINYAILPKEVIEERGREKKNVKKWDKILVGLSIIPAIGIYVLSGLDYRLSWSPDFHISMHIISLSILLLASMLFTWSMVSNKFFSTMVRIQKERGHTLVAEGPYKYVRHPGYLGYILMVIATPFALGSIYALLMSFLVMIIFIIRAAMEDRILLYELEGYREYSQKVRYKLIPFIW